MVGNLDSSSGHSSNSLTDRCGRLNAFGGLYQVLGCSGVTTTCAGVAAVLNFKSTAGFCACCCACCLSDSFSAGAAVVDVLLSVLAEAGAAESLLPGSCLTSGG